MQIFLRAITPKRKVFMDYSRFVSEAQAAIRTDFAPPVLADFASTVQTWSTPVQFRFHVLAFSDRLVLKVTPEGAGKQIWHWTDEGTRAHLIVPHGPYPLQFKIGGMPKTRPGRIAATGGRRGRWWRSSYGVWHPGTAARNFTTQIMRKHSPRFRRVMANMVRRYVRRGGGP